MAITNEPVAAYRLFGYLLLGTFGSVLFVVCRRLFFHPLAHIPGPKLAATTWLYQSYYSLAGGQSRYYKEIERLHGIYGMKRPICHPHQPC
jgi:hypothetical protein